MSDNPYPDPERLTYGEYNIRRNQLLGQLRRIERLFVRIHNGEATDLLPQGVPLLEAERLRVAEVLRQLNNRWHDQQYPQGVNHGRKEEES